MSKVMLVNVTHVEESRVAVLDNGVLETYEIETLNRAHIKGNIYNAVVDSIHPSLEAAFLRISPELNGFLPLDEVNFKLLPSRNDGRKTGRIGQHLHPGQKIMAQVVREPFAGKPPTVSTYFSLPGRFLVLMPGVESAGVSRKIEDATHRDRLKKIVSELRLPEGFGLIVRTAGLGQTKAELQRDLRYLLRLWQSIQRASQAAVFPSLVYREADIVIRTIRDHFTPDISEVWIDSQETYDKALEFVRDVMPQRAKTLRLYSGERPLFNKYNLEEQIETIYKRRVPLPSGGEIVIDGTEALTAVDVNSARSKRQSDAEDNATTTNLEAARETARQLRLRDLGGLVVIDFIDMLAARNKKKVEDTMREAMRGDKAKHDITRLSKMGLMEIARQRLKGAKMGAMYNTCPTCEGYGLVKNLEAAALAGLRKLQSRGARSDLGRVRLSVPTDVAVWMLNHKRDELLQIERRHRVRVDIEPNNKLLRHEVEIETFPREKTDEVPAARTTADRPTPPAPPPAPPAEARREPESAPSEAEAPQAAEPPVPRKRRRRRRKGAQEDGVEPESAAVAVDSPTVGSADPGPGPAAKVVPIAEPARDEAPAVARETPAADGESETGGDAAGRKRRRRRRGRGRGRQAGDSAQSEGTPREESVAPVTPPPEHGPELQVPRNVSSDELMPAAVGGRRRSARKTSARKTTPRG